MEKKVLWTHELSKNGRKRKVQRQKATDHDPEVIVDVLLWLEHVQLPAELAHPCHTIFQNALKGF